MSWKNAVTGGGGGGGGGRWADGDLDGTTWLKPTADEHVLAPAQFGMGDVGTNGARWDFSGGTKIVDIDTSGGNDVWFRMDGTITYVFQSGGSGRLAIRTSSPEGNASLTVGTLGNVNPVLYLERHTSGGTFINCQDTNGTGYAAIQSDGRIQSRSAFETLNTSLPGASASGRSRISYDPTNDELVASRNGGSYEFFVFCADESKVTAGAPYTNDGYVTVNINGVNRNLMTTAG